MATINLGKVRVTDKGVWVPDYAGGYGILDVVTFEKGSYMSKVSANSAALTDRASWVPFVDTASIEQAIQEANEAAGLADQARLAIEGNLAKLELADAEHSSQIKSIENVISTMNPNQSAQLSVSGRKTVSLPKNASNGGMSVKLEGLTASQKITNGNFANGITGWIAHSGAVLSVLNGKLKVALSSTTYGAVRKDNVSIISGNKYYKAVLLSHDSATSETLNFQLGANADTSVIVANVNTLRSIIQTASTTGNTSLYVGKYSQTTVFNIFIERVMLVDLTATFGSGNEPDVATCDAMFSSYFEGRKNFEVTGRIRSVGKNLFNGKWRVGKTYTGGVLTDSSTQSVTELCKVSGATYYRFDWKDSLVNAIYQFDEERRYIPLDSSNTGTGRAVTTDSNCRYIALRLTTITPSTQEVRLTKSLTATPYEPYKETSLYLTAPELRSVQKAWDEIRKGANGYEHVKRILSKTLAAGDITSLVAGTNIDYVTVPISAFANWHGAASTGTTGLASVLDNRFTKEVAASGFDVAGNAGSYAYGLTNFLLTFAKGAYADLAAAKSGLTGITINYKALTPVISPISFGGILNSAENGTVYHEPVIADAGVYGTNMPILLTDYPISTLEEIIVHKDGIDTYLDVSTAVIAGDKLSFTHPSLISGDLVLFTYAFAKESTNGNITATFYDSNVVKIDTVTGKAYKITDVVTNGVLTRTLIEV